MTERTLDPGILERWVGRQEEAVDLIDERRARQMQATLDRNPVLETGEALPPLWHWLYFPAAVPQRGLGRDGHPKLGGFLPPVDLPRRMWAGGRLGFTRALRLGETALRRSRIQDVRLKEGRSGPLCFVTVRHEISNGQDFCFWEEHDIVYRADPGPGSPPAKEVEARRDFEWVRDVEPDPVLLFRYSALTFNGHRIHYDRQYCMEVEGYPGLVFHGPLTATLLFDLLLEKAPDAWVSSFEFRAVSPLFDTAAFRLMGRRDNETAELWAANSDGGLAMTAKAALA